MTGFRFVRFFYIGVLVIAFLAAGFPAPAAAADGAERVARADKSKKSKKTGSAERREEAEEAKEEDAGEDYTESITGPRLLPHSSFRFSLDQGVYEQGDHEQGYARVRDVQLNLGGSYAVLPGELSIGADIGMNIITGDKSGFLFSSFGTNFIYTFYRKRPLLLSTGVGFSLMNQSFDDVFSPDIFHLRPFLGAGTGFWRLYFGPYVGFPIFIDINNDNDPGYLCKRGIRADTDPRFIDVLPKEDKEKSREEGELRDDNTLKDGTCFPDRRFNYKYDRDPFGVDYGIPVSLRIVKTFFLVMEPSGMTWLYPDTATTFWLTPGLLYRAGFIVVGGGVRFRLWTSDSDEEDRTFWTPVIYTGVSF